ncbi:hypothetical protein EDB83DRAFT_2537107 [Lactarius deliciosus]|nr:hypothetical protein EDB83DRAFT_2537107 [Lactarius deliciosus]
MTSQTPWGYSYSLESTSGVSLPRGSVPEPLELGGSQSCFALSGSIAEARSLDQRWRAGTASEAQGPVFVRPGGIMQQDTEPMSVPMAMAVDRISSGHGGQRAGPGYGSTTIDTFQTVFPAAIESRRVDVFPSPHTIQTTPPMTPILVDSGLSILSNTMPSLLDHSGGGPSMFSPFVSGIQPGLHDHGFGCYAMGDTQDLEMGGPVARQRRPKTQRKATLTSILQDPQGLKLTAVDLLTAIINGNGKFEGFRNAFFSPKNRDSLIGLLDRLIQDDKG